DDRGYTSAASPRSPPTSTSANPPSLTADEAGSSLSRSPTSTAAPSGTWKRSKPTTSTATAKDTANHPTPAKAYSAPNHGLNSRFPAGRSSAEQKPFTIRPTSALTDAAPAHRSEHHPDQPTPV